MIVDISARALYKIRAITTKFPLEWGGLLVGKFNYDESFDNKHKGTIKSIYVKDVFIPEQEVSGADCDMDADEINQCYMNEIIPSGYLEEKYYVLGWVHSHVNMDTFWSGQDEKAITAMHTDKYLLSIVVNKSEKTLCRLDTFSPLKAKFDSLPFVCSEFYNQFTPVITLKSKSGGIEWEIKAPASITEKDYMTPWLNSVFGKGSESEPNPDYIDIDEIINTKLKKRSTTVTHYIGGGIGGGNIHSNNKNKGKYSDWRERYVGKEEKDNKHQGGSSEPPSGGGQAGNSPANPPANTKSYFLNPDDDIDYMYGYYNSRYYKGE